MADPGAPISNGWGYDSLANVFVLYGGNLEASKTWRFALDGSKWGTGSLTTSGAPSVSSGAKGREQFAFAYDSTNHKFYTNLGRDDASGAFNDTWAFDLAALTWTQVAALGPSARQLAPMAYQIGRNRMVLFGGTDTVSGITTFSDTWEFNPGTNVWASRSPATVPGTRYLHSMSYNPVDGLIYMAGGISTFPSGALLSDVWTWDGTNWTLLTGVLPTAAGKSGCLSWSPVNNTMMYVLAANNDVADTYLLVSGSWVLQSPAHQPIATTVFQNVAPPSAIAGPVLCGQDVTLSVSVPWQWTGTDWIDLTVDPPVPPVPPLPTQPPIQPSRPGPYHIYQTTPPDSGGVSTTALMGPAGLSLEGALGDIKDFLTDKAKQAAKVGMPLVAPSDALGKIGLGRLMPRGLSETDLSYATRLQGAWSTWPNAGTAFGLLTALFQTGYTNVVLAQPNGSTFYTLDSGGNLIINKGVSWTPTFVGDPFWSRFDVIFPAPLPPSWVSGGVPASNSDESNLIRLLISYWKPAYATANRIIIVTAGRLLGFPSPIRKLGSSNGVLGGNTSVVWSP